MSHIICPACGSSEHTTGYGLAAGGMSSYTICECGEILERDPDRESWCPTEPKREEGD